MGGLGSGRQGGRTKVEACRSLDVNRIRKAGALSPGWSGSWEWTRDGERVASIGMRGGYDRIVLTYRWRRGSDEWKDVEEPIHIRWVSCRFGGKRPYFQCPGVVNGIACDRLAVKLYCDGPYYLCRRCYRLTYASRSEDRWDRALRRANKIRIKLGGEAGTASAFPRRPKGMWAKTYKRQMNKVFAAEEEAEEKLALFAARLLNVGRQSARRGRSGSRKGFWR